MKRSREPEDNIDSDSSEANVALRPVPKFTNLDSCAIEDDEGAVVMKCSLPPHKEVLAFRTYDEYEAHYNKTHTNRCLECRKNFPTEHLLGVHIEEIHDPLVRVRREKGEHTYSCFVEGCERKCMTHQKRRMHLVDKHMYPKNFFFGITKDGIDGRRSLLVDSGHHRRRSSVISQHKDTRRPSTSSGAKASHSQDTGKSPPPNTGKEEPSDEPADTVMEDLTGAMSSLNFVPPSVRFGRGRAGFAKR